MSRFYEEQLSRAALYELARVDIARGMLSWREDAPEVPLNSTPIEKELWGQTWELRYQDVAGLVDICHAPAEILTALGIDADAFFARREEMLSNWPNGSRAASLEQSMALLELDPALRPVLTQASGRAQINPATMPVELLEALAGVDGAKGRAKQPEVVEIVLRPQHMK